jgi:dCMP deaminase
VNNKWDERFLNLAIFVAQWSKDPRAKVGAVVTSKKAGAIALGYNGFPAGVEDSAERLKNTRIKLDMIIHAEQNALFIAGRAAEGGDLFVWGKPICSRCAGLIIQAGITRVVAENPEADQTLKWYETGKLAIEMLKEAGIKVDLADMKPADDVAAA